MKKTLRAKKSMTRSLTGQLLAMGKQYGVTVEINHGRRSIDRGNIELHLPEGKQFDTQLHTLLTEQQWNYTLKKLEPWVDVVEEALGNMAEYGPRVKDCPADCPCKEV
jgi:hypothetical protein